MAKPTLNGNSVWRVQDDEVCERRVLRLWEIGNRIAVEVRVQVVGE